MAKKTEPRKFPYRAKQISVTKYLVKVEGQEFDLYTLYDLCDNLRGTGYAGPRLVIHDMGLKKLLEKLKVYSVSARGSGWAGPNFDKFAARIEATMQAKWAEDAAKKKAMTG